MSHEDVIREIEERYRLTGRAFNEFQRRHWAATEAIKLGRGGISIVSKALRISPNTIKRGIQEIATGQAEILSVANARIRKPGGGRKPKRSSATASLSSNPGEDSAVTQSPPGSPNGPSHGQNEMPPLAIEKEFRPGQHD